MNLILSVVVFTSVMSYTSEPLKENSYVNQLIESYEKKMDADLANLKSQILNYLDKKENIACLTTVPPTTTPKPTTGQSTTPKPTTGKPTSDKHTSTTMQPVPGNSSCATLFKSGERKDGVYTINPDNLGAFQVRCDMTSDGGGWTVFQRRVSGSVDFYRNWQNYSDGFGDLTGNLWLGLDKIHRLTESGQNVLRVDLMNFDNETAYAKYVTFAVAPESSNYTLSVDDYSGNATNSLSYHDGRYFSTYDRNDDNRCASGYKAAWWFYECYQSSLNGLYFSDGRSSDFGIRWNGWSLNSLKKAEMKIRPA